MAKEARIKNIYNKNFINIDGLLGSILILFIVSTCGEPDLIDVMYAKHQCTAGTIQEDSASFPHTY